MKDFIHTFKSEVLERFLHDRSSIGGSKETKSRYYFFRNGSWVKIYEMFMAFNDMEWNIIHCSEYISLWQKGKRSSYLDFRTIAPGNSLYDFIPQWDTDRRPLWSPQCGPFKMRTCKSIMIIHIQRTLKLFVVQQTFPRVFQHWQFVSILCMQHQKFYNIIMKIKF